MRRLTVLIPLALLLLTPTGAAARRAPAPLPTLIFPIVGGATYYEDDFGDPRPQGPHQGNDLMGPRNQPIVAVEAGVVTLHSSGRSGPMLYLRSRTREYLYIHLSDDRTNGDDNTGGADTAYAPGIEDGVHVRAGQLIAFVGNSGDAAGGPTHLHFEEHLLNGTALDPYARLRAATIVAFAMVPPKTGGDAVGARSTTVAMTLTGTLAWAAGAADGSFGRVAVRLDAMGVVGSASVPSHALVVLAAGPDALTAANAIGIGKRVAIGTMAAAPTLARQAMRPAAWEVGTIAAAPAPDARR